MGDVGALALGAALGTVDGIIDVGAMEKLLNTIWIGTFKLRVNA